MAGLGRSQVADGTINAVKYTSSILQPKMLPLARDLFRPGSDFPAGQCPMPCSPQMHEVVCSACLEILDWPGNSPDLNPTENL